MFLVACAAAAMAAVPDASLDYRVEVGPGARELTVEARLAGAGARFTLDEGLGPFLRDVRVRTRAGWRALAPMGDSLEAAPCAAGECVLRYRFALAEAARSVQDYHRALMAEAAVVAPPSSWLLRPLHVNRGAWRVRLSPSPGVRAACGLSSPHPHDFTAALEHLRESPYCVFGEFDTETVAAPGGVVELALTSRAGPDRRLVRGWASDAARAVAAAYGGLPVRRVLVVVLPGRRRAVGFGTTLGNGGASVLVWVSPSAGPEQLARDWLLTHELLHLGLPNLPRDYRWLEEGLATYLEPLARARAGLITPAEAWASFVRGMPRGLRRPPGGGVPEDRWGPTYWGGALFWLHADLALRERSAHRRSLDDVLRSIHAEQGTIHVSWSMDRLLRVADGPAGAPVVRGLLARMGAPPYAADLDALWARLGVVAEGRSVRFDDRAPLGPVRRAMTAAEPLPPGQRSPSAP